MTEEQFERFMRSQAAIVESNNEIQVELYALVAEIKRGNDERG